MTVQGLHGLFIVYEMTMQGLHTLFIVYEMITQGLHGLFIVYEMTMQGLHGLFIVYEMTMQGLHGLFIVYEMIVLAPKNAACLSLRLIYGLKNKAEGARTHIPTPDKDARRHLCALVFIGKEDGEEDGYKEGIASEDVPHRCPIAHQERLGAAGCGHF